MARVRHALGAATTPRDATGLRQRHVELSAAAGKLADRTRAELALMADRSSECGRILALVRGLPMGVHKDRKNGVSFSIYAAGRPDSACYKRNLLAVHQQIMQIEPGKEPVAAFDLVHQRVVRCLPPRKIEGEWAGTLRDELKAKRKAMHAHDGEAGNTLAGRQPEELHPIPRDAASMPADLLVASAFESREWVLLPAVWSERAGGLVLPPTPQQIMKMDPAAQAVCALMMLHPPTARDSRPTTTGVRARLDAMIEKLESRMTDASKAQGAQVLRTYLEAGYPLAQTGSTTKRKHDGDGDGDGDDAPRLPDSTNEAAPVFTLRRSRIEQAADAAERSRDPGLASSRAVDPDLD
jgi:hypothetical protein